MKVKELKAMLEKFDDDLDVVFSYNYGDHWRTQVAPEISNVEIQGVAWSGYHEMRKVIDWDDETEADEEVVVIS